MHKILSRVAVYALFLALVTEPTCSKGHLGNPGKPFLRESGSGPLISDWFRGWMPGRVHENTAKRERSPCFGLVPGLDAGEWSRKHGKT